MVITHDGALGELGKLRTVPKAPEGHHLTGQTTLDRADGPATCIGSPIGVWSVVPTFMVHVAAQYSQDPPTTLN